ncbi:hypothetical protein N480_20475 [Pseudoalteromonas luteoviolacea S2607]|nr:hypothetical protein N480_20475 [Pseudoalteromonas luteoviolacea S2607]
MFSMRLTIQLFFNKMATALHNYKLVLERKILDILILTEVYLF